MSVTLHRGSILDCKVDAIVNPANSFLRHGAGLARIIADAAVKVEGDSPEDHRRASQWWRENKAAPLIPTGGAYATHAGVLPFKAVIHAVGPIWGGGGYCERALLFSAYSEAFALAVSLDCRSVAAPAISAGIFGMPINVGAYQAMAAAGAFEDRLDITFALMDDVHIEQFTTMRHAHGIKEVIA